MEKSSVSAYRVEGNYQQVSPFFINQNDFAVVVVVIALLTGLIQIFDFFVQINYTLFKLVQIGLFLMLGTLNAFFTETSFEFETGLRGKLVFSSLLGIAIFAVLSGVYFFIGNGSFPLAAATGSAFLLPLIVDQGWKAFYFVANTQNSSLWYNDTITDLTEVTEFTSGIAVQIVLQPNPNEKTVKAFTLLAPPEMKLGHFFDHCVVLRNMQNQKIVTTSPTEKSFGWLFYEDQIKGLKQMKGLKKRQFNPELSIAQNLIHEYTVITAERIFEEKESD